MNKNFLIVLLCMAGTFKFISSNAQTQKPFQSVISGHGVINFTALANEELKNPPKQERQKNNEEKDELQKGIPKYLPVPANAKFNSFDATNITRVESNNPLANSPAPVISFNGILDNGQTVPPDVNGAAGPTALFETLNSQYRIYSKTGAVVKTLTLKGFWSGLSTVGSPFSDPHVVYDAASSRWIACTIGKLKTSHYAIFVAASQTTDPGGVWNEFSIDTGPSTTLPDYPLLGYNKNWVVITTNDFFNNVFAQSRILVLNKANLYANTLGTVSTFFDTQLFTISPAETMDANETTEYMLNNYNGNSAGSGFVKICTITGAVNSPVYTSGALCGVNQPWSETPVDAPQKNSTKLINTNGTKMRSVIVRNGSIWAAHTIFLPAATPNHSSVDWWQIRPVDSTVLQYGRIDDPTGVNYISFPSMAVTANNSLLIGASVFSSNIFASDLYAYRNGSDPANTLRNTYTFKNGLAVYYKTFGGTRNRWGDYTATCLDPADGSFWTLQEFASTGSNKWGTAWANVAAVATPLIGLSVAESKKIIGQLSINPNPNNGIFNVSFTAPKAGHAILSILGQNSLPIFTQNVVVVAGINNLPVKLSTLSTGEYVVSIKYDFGVFEGKMLVGK